MYTVVPTHVHRQNRARSSYGLTLTYVDIVKSTGGLFGDVSGINNNCGLTVNNAFFVKRINRFNCEHQTISRTNPKRHGIFLGLKSGNNQNSIVVEPSCINKT